MATKKRKISGYVPPDLFDKFESWRKEQEYTSSSQALVFLLERFSAHGGFSDVSLADRVKLLEERVEKLEAQGETKTPSKGQAPDEPKAQKQKDLAVRLGTTESTLNKRRNRKDFFDWSLKQDGNWGWEYKDGLYYPRKAPASLK